MLKFYKIRALFAAEIAGIVYEAHTILSLTAAEARDHLHKLEEVPAEIARALGLSHPAGAVVAPPVVTKEALLASGDKATPAVVASAISLARAEATQTEQVTPAEAEHPVQDVPPLAPIEAGADLTPAPAPALAAPEPADAAGLSTQTEQVAPAEAPANGT
jgi:hypothetical protein